MEAGRGATRCNPAGGRRQASYSPSRKGQVQARPSLRAVAITLVRAKSGSNVCSLVYGGVAKHSTPRKQRRAANASDDTRPAHAGTASARPTFSEGSRVRGDQRDPGRVSRGRRARAHGPPRRRRRPCGRPNRHHPSRSSGRRSSSSERASATRISPPRSRRTRPIGRSAGSGPGSRGPARPFTGISPESGHLAWRRSIDSFSTSRSVTASKTGAGSRPTPLR